jgi:hypothetical protein
MLDKQKAYLRRVKQAERALKAAQAALDKDTAARLTDGRPWVTDSTYRRLNDAVIAAEARRRDALLNRGGA